MLATRPFVIPEHLNADTPAEFRGIRRDQVRMMTLDPSTGSTNHTDFSSLDRYLKKGDLLVLNNSRTIPAVLKNENVEIRLSRRLSDCEWEALLVRGSFKDGEEMELFEGLKATISGRGAESPLCTLSFSKKGVELYEAFYRFGEPLRYEYIEEQWPLEAYQTVYASVPGSVEMPSAGRALTWGLIGKLKQKGVKVAFVQLHAGLSYYEKDRWPNPERHIEEYNVPRRTADLVNTTRANGGHVVAVGTTVVRALESAASGDQVEATEGSTNLYIKSDYKLQAVDGLVTGFHEPEASHLDLLTAFVEEEKLMNGYREALDAGYLWHEFGDMNLILPEHS